MDYLNRSATALLAIGLVLFSMAWYRIISFDMAINLVVFCAALAAVPLFKSKK